MIDPNSQKQLKNEIIERIKSDRVILDQLRKEIQPLKSGVRRIQPRNATSISLVGTDGGNNQVQFDPFLVQIIRVVDSSNNEYCLEAITPTTKVSQLTVRQFNSDGSPKTALGEMMFDLGVKQLTELSHMIRSNDDGKPTSPSWVQVYRELIEWAILYSIAKKDFGTDTLIVFDGLLRSKVFAKELFKTYRENLAKIIEKQDKEKRRKIFLVGLAKHSKVLSRYRLAMALENVLNCDYSAYVEIPQELEEKAYVWSEYARGQDTEGEVNKYVAGKMYFVKFGNGARDPIWPVDIFMPQTLQSQAILGCLLSDAINGFPIPFYPMCLQKAHENAALVDFDFDILQDQIFEGIRNVLGNESPKLDTFRLQDTDPSQRRY